MQLTKVEYQPLNRVGLTDDVLVSNNFLAHMLP